MSSMIVFDRGDGRADQPLMGNPPGNLADNIYYVDGSVPIASMLAWIDAYAKSQGGLNNLYVMCHGYEGNYDLSDQSCVTTVSGGYGLLLGTEGLLLNNVSQTQVLNGDIGVITIFACATADTASYNVGTRGDGMRFCGEMAMLTGAYVIAATQTQFYAVDQSFWQWLWGNPGTIDFGNWEGPVYQFNPDGSAPIQIH